MWKYAQNICLRTLFVPRREQISKSMAQELWGTEKSKDKYPSILSRQIEAIVFIILQILFATIAIDANPKGETPLSQPFF